MSTETTSSGRAAYEEWADSHTLDGEQDWPPWDDLDAEDHEIWEGIGGAAARPVYAERARLVAYLAACYPAVRTPDPGDDDYQVVFVFTPAGQMSWHIHADDLHLLGHVPVAGAEWDGHTTEVKYERLADLTGRLSRGGGLGGIVASVPRGTLAELSNLRASLRSLTDRAEASRAITGDEADEYRKLTGGSVQ